MKIIVLALVVTAIATPSSPVRGSYPYFFVRAGVPSLEGGVMVVDITPDLTLPGYWPDPVGVGWTLPTNRQVIHIHRGEGGVDVPKLQLGEVITLSEDWEGTISPDRLVVEGESYIPYREEDRADGRLRVENYPQVYELTGGPLWALVTCDGPAGMVVKYLVELE